MEQEHELETALHENDSLKEQLEQLKQDVRENSHNNKLNSQQQQTRK